MDSHYANHESVLTDIPEVGERCEFLTAGSARKYYWVDNGIVTPGWYATANGKTAIDGGASSVTIDPGKGVWVFGKGMTLNFPAPTL